MLLGIICVSFFVISLSEIKQIAYLIPDLRGPASDYLIVVDKNWLKIL